MISIHDTCEVARKGEPCAICHVQAGEPCHASGVHLCRVCLAARDGLITMLALASLMHDMDVFTGASLVLDAEAAA